MTGATILTSARRPANRIAARADQRGVALTTLIMGEALNLNSPNVASHWWRNLLTVPVQREDASMMATE